MSKIKWINNDLDIVLWKWRNLHQNDTPLGHSSHNIQEANFPAALKFNGNWRNDLEFGALDQVGDFVPPHSFLSSYLLLPAFWLDRIICGTNYPRSPECPLEWSRGQEDAKMTAECLLISSWRDGRSKSLSGLKWVSGCSCIQLLKTKWSGNKGLTLNESAVTHLCWIRHNCWRRIYNAVI